MVVMTKEEQQALKAIQNAGYDILYDGYYVAQIGTDKIFEATEEWIKETGQYCQVKFEVGDLVYTDSSAILKLSTVSIKEFKIYQKQDTEKLVAKFLK